MLYPLKFKPILKEKIWGGTRLRDELNKEYGKDSKIGESWEIAAINGDKSVVENGALSGRDIVDVIADFKGSLVGNKVYAEHGNQFPLLIKFIDANENLSVQVHPDDRTAGIRHDSPGKTEMWYILRAEEDARLIAGFDSETSVENVNKYLSEACLESLLKSEIVERGDAFFIPSGCVHSIGKGILLAEIQQSSDITYRLYDYNRKDDKGEYRELHIDLAGDVMNTEGNDNCRLDYSLDKEGFSNIVKCEYFSTNVLSLSENTKRDLSSLDSFVIYMCLSGKLDVEYGTGKSVSVEKGETVLVPSCIDNIELKVNETTRLLEVYIE